MFESIQDYMDKLIDLDELIERMITSEEYQNVSNSRKEKIDMFIENLKDAKSEEEIINMFYSDAFLNLDVPIDYHKLLDLATRTSGGFGPVLEPGELAAFIDLCIMHNDDERLFRLAYNYDEDLFDKEKIEDYFIRNKNVFYINELACNNLHGLHYDVLIDALVNSDQLDELKYFVANVSDKNVNVIKVLNRIKELENK